MNKKSYKILFYISLIFNMITLFFYLHFSANSEIGISENITNDSCSNNNKSICYDDLRLFVLPKSNTIKLKENYEAYTFLMGVDDKATQPLLIVSDSIDSNNELRGKIDTIKVLDGIGLVQVNSLHIGKNIIYGKYIVDIENKIKVYNFNTSFIVEE